jgi:hypothetical protein
MEKENAKTGEISYYLQMLGTAIVHPNFKEVILLCPEMIIKQNCTTQNGCKRNAATPFLSSLNGVPLNQSNQDLLVNFIEYWEYSDKARKILYHNSWVTDFTLSKENAYTIMRGGRARWKIENETFNTPKNQGYHFEHNYGLGKKYLAVVFAMLMMLAFLIDQIQQLCCALFRSVWKKLKSKKALWESERSYF